MTYVIYNCLFLGWKQKQPNSAAWNTVFEQHEIVASDLGSQTLRDPIRTTNFYCHTFHLGSGWPWCTVVRDFSKIPHRGNVSSRVPSRTKTSGASHVCIYCLFIIYRLFLILLLIIFIITIIIFYLLLISCLFIICYKIYKLSAIYYLLWNVHYLSFVISCLLLFMMY